jgi:hypothetical protein
MIAVGFGLSDFRKAKANPREVLPIALHADLPSKKGVTDETILLLHDESGSPKPRFRNVAGSKVTQRANEGTPGCNCDRWGHPYPDRVEHNVQAQPNLSTSGSASGS